jgi:hypothetical protein
MHGRLGVHESTIMKIGGWRTRSVFDRYNIVDENHLADAATRLEAKREQLEHKSKETNDPETEEKEFGHSRTRKAAS